jgi:hypothetical protein
MYKVLGFQTKQALEAYLNDNTIAAAKIVGFAIDASGQFVVIIAP